MVNISPRRVAGNVRIWKPVGRHGERTPSANLVSNDTTPVQAFLANGQPVEWHYFSDANHGFRHPDNAGFQPHYADLTWPLVTDFLQRRV